MQAEQGDDHEEHVAGGRGQPVETESELVEGEVAHRHCGVQRTALGHDEWLFEELKEAHGKQDRAQQ